MPVSSVLMNAALVPYVEVVVNETTDSTVVLTATWTHFAVAVAIPILVGLLTKLQGNPKVKVVVTMFLTALGAFIVANTTTTGETVFQLSTLVTFVETFVLQLAVFFGIIKPLGVRKVLLPEQGLG